MIEANINDDWQLDIYYLDSGEFSLAYVYHPKCRQEFIAFLHGNPGGIRDGVPSLEYQLSYLRCVVCHTDLPKNTLDVIKLHLLSRLPVSLT